MNDLQKKIYERFIKYVKVDTTSNGMSQTVPTTASQFDIDKNGFVFGEIPANAEGPSIGFLAHMDTVEDFSGKDISPVLHTNYQGGEIVINEGKGLVLTPKMAPALLKC